MLEACELLLPVGAKLGLHAALDEGPAHRRRLALQLGQFGDVFRRQRLRDGGEKLRHLHDRAFQPAQRRGELGGILGAVEIDAEKARACHARRHAADIRCRRWRSGGRGRRSGFFPDPVLNLASRLEVGAIEPKSEVARHQRRTSATFCTAGHNCRLRLRHLTLAIGERVMRSLFISVVMLKLSASLCSAQAAVNSERTLIVRGHGRAQVPPTTRPKPRAWKTQQQHTVNAPRAPSAFCAKWPRTGWRSPNRLSVR